MKKKIAIDTATIYPGKGGSGGGIWTYTKNILAFLDKQELNKYDIEIVVFVNKDFTETYNQIKVELVNHNSQNSFYRLFYVHIILPIICYRKKVKLLHKLATEIPLVIKNNVVVTVHDFMTEFYSENNYTISGVINTIQQVYFSWITKYAIQNSKAVITPSNAINSEVKRRYKKEKVITTELGCFLQNTIPQYKSINTTLLIYYVAGYYPHKGHIKAIELFELLLEKYKVDACLIFRGHISSIDYHQKVINKSLNSKFSSKIKFEQYTQESTIEEVYQKADFIMLLSEYEGFGLPILEAQTMKIPVIASNIEVINEISNGYACLINVGNIYEEVDKVYQFITNKNNLLQTVEMAYQNSKNFSWDLHAKKLLDIYSSIY